MEDNIKLYEYDYAAYFTGRIIEIGPHEGYSPGYLTTVPVPDSIPDGHYAKFEKISNEWIITDREPPEYIGAEQVAAWLEEEKSKAKEPPKVI